MPDKIPHEIQREPHLVVFQEKAGFKDTYGGEAGIVAIEYMRIIPDDVASETLLVFSHPIGRGAYLPICGALAKAGHHVAYVNPRFQGNDTALIMEKCVIDLGAAIRDLKKKFGYRNIIFGGWSGGGSLSLFYQEQAEKPSIQTTPAGDIADLVAAELEPAQGIMLLAAHVSRSVTLTEWMDPSILNEDDPLTRDRALNLYDPENPNQPPYSENFLTSFRAAQIARNRRITDWVQAKLDDFRGRGELNREFAFTVHGTMADPRWLDSSIEPSDREPGVCYLGDPKIVNDGPVGLARFTTLRSWLSQWSYDESKANGLANAANISVPLLAISNTADTACSPSHAQRLFDAVAHADKKLVHVKGATHYYAGQKKELAYCVDQITQWLQDKGFSDIVAA